MFLIVLENLSFRHLLWPNLKPIFRERLQNAPIIMVKTNLRRTLGLNLTLSSIIIVTNLSLDGVKCDYVGKTNQLLELHVSHKHTAVWDHYMRSIDKPYECDVCNWRYGSLQQLKKHKIKYAKICGSFPQVRK